MLPEILLPGEKDGKIWMWHRCLRCPRAYGFPPATRKIFGYIVLTTSTGIMDHEEARRKNVGEIPEPDAKKSTKGSLDRDVALAKLEDDKRLSFIKAWEESEKTKVENKAQKQLADVSAWENSKKASVESQLKKIEEQIEKKKGEYAEKMKKKIALVHKQAEEKRAMVEAKRGEALLKVEEFAAKYCATGHVPKKVLGCFGG
ncbi:uncharacterized protein at3g61260 [Phtheirospermum japonicum]|uniref:Small ribosomal subunit protein uS8c n=1 Tax=Phtheirospermum japonicum TaxID=374723 RepID=A0A830BUN9_9LAMI|nr:uncharacterized protein at3g61260 [Phtheirospermum japonicum]